MGENKKAIPLKEIEEFKKEFAITDAIFEGIKVANGWKCGKQVAENDFRRAYERFRQAPIDGLSDKEAKG